MTAAGPWQDARAVKPTREDETADGFVLAWESTLGVVIAEFSNGFWFNDVGNREDAVTHWARIVAPGEVSDDA